MSGVFDRVLILEVRVRTHLLHLGVDRALLRLMQHGGGDLRESFGVSVGPGEGEIPGSAGLFLAAGVIYLNEPAAVFEGMLSGWARQQQSRMLGTTTITSQVALVRRFVEFAESHPWAWGPGDRSATI